MNLILSFFRTSLPLFALIVILIPLVAGGEEKIVHIGVLAKRGVVVAEKSWGATADYLSRKIPGYHFQVVPLGFDDIIPAVEMQQIDFVLANPSFYIELEEKYNVTRIATLNNRVGNLVASQFGGVIFSLAGPNEITRLTDLRGKRLMAVEETSLGGFHMAWGIFKEQGIDPYKSLDLSFGGTHDAVVYAVLDGRVDAGTVRTDTLERMSEEGLIAIDEFRVIAAVDNEGSNFPFLRSTPLYPEWPFASVTSVGRGLSSTVAIALMQMPSDSQAAIDSKSAGWGVPLNYQPVHELLKRLQIGPYQDYGRITYRDVFNLYWIWFVLGLMAFAFLGAAISYVTHLNNQLKISREKISAAKDFLEQRVRERTQALANTNSDLEQEIQERSKVQQLLQKVSEENRLLLDSAGEGIFGVDVKGRLTFINPVALALLGRTRQELLGDSMHSLTHYKKENGDFYPEHECPIYSVLTSRKTEKVRDDVFWRKDGSSFPVEYTSTPIIENNQVIGVVVVFKDRTEQKKMEQKLRQAAVVFETTAEGILVSDCNNRITMVNPAFTAITGYTEAEVLGQHPDVLNSGYHPERYYQEMWEKLSTEDHWSGEIWNRKKSGEIYPEWLSINVVRDQGGKISNYIAVFSDISTIKDSEKQLEYLAHHDPLTKLPNRLLLQDRLSHAIKSAHRNKSRVAVLFLDLDNFKTINDTMGHHVGDILLGDVAERLQECLREEDTVARFGGDEFIIILEQIPDVARVTNVADKILSAINKPYPHKDRVLSISTSIGISIYPDDGDNSETLIKRADAAMYSAKQQGRNRYAFHETAQMATNQSLMTEV
jgi:diguanylate cyclase (GGDEF)-like protein/PAS domain S-box-containing protein